VRRLLIFATAAWLLIDAALLISIAIAVLAP
jgi:hypothetical protein